MHERRRSCCSINSRSVSVKWRSLLFGSREPRDGDGEFIAKREQQNASHKLNLFGSVGIVNA
uniref:Uncharacterized protein n=1 Tax=Anopheles atroparvus TaxID=41427 RepID=A0AAG5DNW0_ANOAO